MITKFVKATSICIIASALGSASLARADGSGGNRAREVSPRQRGVALNYFDRSQLMRLYNQMLTVAGYQSSAPTVQSTGEYCTQNICTDNLEVSQQFSAPSGQITLRFGVGIWKNFQHSFVWDLDSENHAQMLPVYVGQHIFHRMGGDDIAGALIFHFREVLPGYLNDSEDHNNDTIYISLKSVRCTGPREIAASSNPSCVATTLDGEEVEIGSARSARIYEVLHSPDMASSGVYFGRDVVALGRDQLQISVPNITCRYTDPDSARPQAGSCDFFRKRR